MGGLSSFINGTPANSSGTSTANVPRWMSDYGMNLANNATAVMNTPYTPYGGPRVAGFTPDQTAAQGMVRSTAGKYEPAAEGALKATQGIPGQVNPIYGAAGTAIKGAVGTGALGAASPYLKQADGSFTGDTVNNYMNPYVGNVIDRATQLAMRNYTENVAPSLRAEFIGSGQYGSLGHEAEADRAARDLTEGIQSQALGALDQAYTQGQGAYQADASRYAGLGQTAGQLGASDISARQRTGEDLTSLATQQGTMGLNAAGQAASQATNLQDMRYKDAAAMDTSGQEQQNLNQKSLDTAYGDFINQRDWQKNQIGWGAQIGSSGPPVSSTTTSASQQVGATPSPAATIADLYALYKGTQQAARGGLMQCYADGGEVSAPPAPSSDEQMAQLQNLPQWLKELIAQAMTSGGGAMSGAGGMAPPARVMRAGNRRVLAPSALASAYGD